MVTLRTGSPSNLCVELPFIGGDLDWSDLKIGDKAILNGKTKFKQGDASILVGQPDWTYIVVAITDEGGAQTGGRSYQTSQVNIVVERTEDGLQTSISDITFVG